MTSKTGFVVFIYPEAQTLAVPAGRLTLIEDGAALLQSTFGYGRQYVQRRNCLALDPLTLALPGPGAETLREPPHTPTGQLVEFGVFRDAAPDRWGRRVIENKLRRTGPLAESEYLAHAGSNRVGALDFRHNPKEGERPGQLAQLLDLAYLQEAAERIDAGEPVPARLEQIFDAGPSMGGARPKAVIEADGRQWLAKFAMPGDPYSIPQVEYATLLLAREAGLSVPPIRLEHIGAARPVMLIERFDRIAQPQGYARRHFISALTLLARHESESPYTSYAQIAEAIAAYGAAATIKQDQSELFGRMVFNILVNNNDDHLRNHGFVWNVATNGWQLSPLYDVVPAPMMAVERYLHLGVGKQGRLATLPNAMSQHGVFGLTRPQAIAIIERIATVVREWKNTFEAADVSAQDMDRVASALRHPRAAGLDFVSGG